MLLLLCMHFICSCLLISYVSTYMYSIILHNQLSTAHGVCPPSEYIPKKCRTCCCLPSDNVEFYHPDGPNTVCGASESATYKVSLISQYSSTCHPDFPVPADFGTPFFTGLLITSHGAVTGYDKCLNHIGDGLLHYLKYIDSNTEEVLEGATTAATYALAENIYYDIYITDASRILGNRKRKTGYINVNPNNSYSTVESKLVSQRRYKCNIVQDYTSFPSLHIGAKL